MTQALIWAAVAMVTVAALMSLWRMAAGPSTLDRMVGADVLLSVVLVGVSLSMVAFANDSGIVILLVLSMVAFTGGVSVARLLAPRTPERQRYRRADRQGES